MFQLLVDRSANLSLFFPVGLLFSLCGKETYNLQPSFLPSLSCSVNIRLNWQYEQSGQKTLK